MPSAFYLQKALNKSWLFLYKKILLWKMRLKERVDPNLASTALRAAPCRQSVRHHRDALISHFIFLFVPCHPWQWLGILFVFKSIWLSCRLRLVCKYFSPVIMYYWMVAWAHPPRKSWTWLSLKLAKWMDTKLAVQFKQCTYCVF